MNTDEILEKEIGDIGSTKNTLGNVWESTDAQPIKEKKVRFMDGWVSLDRSEFGDRGKFYPNDWTFYIKPADVKAIRNWSMLDENNLASVNTALNEILKESIKIQSSTGNIIWSQINSWDRFWFISKIREYTFQTGDNKIEFDDNCPECGEILKYTLSSNSLIFDLPDTDIINNHWNETNRTWNINPKLYDIEAPSVILYTPTLEKDNLILEWVSNSIREKKNVDSSFIKFLPWLLEKTTKDEKIFDRWIVDAQVKYNSWNVDMFSFMDEVLRNISIVPSEQLMTICPKCGSEVHSNVRFPNGTKSLFMVPNKHRKFGSK